MTLCTEYCVVIVVKYKIQRLFSFTFLLVMEFSFLNLFIVIFPGKSFSFHYHVARRKRRGDAFWL